MSQKIIHTVIATTAKRLAEECYEVLASDNGFYEMNPDMKRYVKRAWKDYIPFARQALTDVLTKDFSHEIALGSYTPEAVDLMKHEIYEALLIDSSFKAPAAPRSGLVLH